MAKLVRAYYDRDRGLVSHSRTVPTTCMNIDAVMALDPVLVFQYIAEEVTIHGADEEGQNSKVK